jgi:neurotransmitter:Na+ symporter, NSS family
MNGGTFSFGLESYLFFLFTLGVNLLVFSRGIRRGVEIVAKYAMPMLLVLGVILAVRVLTLPRVDGRNAADGLAHMWRIDWSTLANANVWLDATGQIFFTLSLGFGMIQTYASYLRREDDIVLNGLSTCGMNEFVEIILGGAIVVPAAVIFFGPAMTSQIVSGGTFDIGFYTLPVIFQEIPGGQIFGTMWFMLLFLAGLTSSVAMFTPLLLFVTQELKVDRKRAVKYIGVGIFVLMQPVVLFMHRGVLDELDYWAGTFLLVVFAAFEAVVFAWCFGMRKGWRKSTTARTSAYPGSITPS